MTRLGKLARWPRRAGTGTAAQHDECCANNQDARDTTNDGAQRRPLIARRLFDLIFV